MDSNIIIQTNPDPTFSNMGANHYMRTHADLYLDGFVACWTRADSETIFGGYIGVVEVCAFDAVGDLVGRTNGGVSIGVDGTWLGHQRSHRYIEWKSPLFRNGRQIPTSELSRITLLRASHDWRFEVRIMQETIDALAKLVTIAGALQ